MTSSDEDVCRICVTRISNENPRGWLQKSCNSALESPPLEPAPAQLDCGRPMAIQKSAPGVMTAQVASPCMCGIETPPTVPARELNQWDWSTVWSLRGVIAWLLEPWGVCVCVRVCGSGSGCEMCSQSPSLGSGMLICNDGSRGRFVKFV